MFAFNYYSSNPQEEDLTPTYNEEEIIPPPPEFQESYLPQQYLPSNMSHNFLYGHQLQMPTLPRTVSPALSVASSNYRYSASPDIGPSVSRAGSPVPMSIDYSNPFAPLAAPRPLPSYDALRYNPYLDRSPSPYSSISAASPALSMFSSATSASNYTMDGRLSSLSTDTRRSHISTASDSGVSTLIDEANIVEPPELNEEIRVHPQLTDMYNKELDAITCRSMLKKTRYMREHVEELREEPVSDVKRGNSRLRKEYQTPEEIAERERNNAASRKSRNKKKVLDKMSHAEGEFQRIDNADIVEMRKFMSSMIYTLEEQLMTSGGTKNDIQKLRSACGVPFYDPQAAFEAMIPQ